MKYMITLESDKYIVEDNIGVYKAILNGKIKKYPKNFWTGEQGIENSLVCTRYLIEDVLNCTDEDLKKLTLKTFEKYKLKNMLHRLYGSSPYKIINTLYEGRLHPWEMSWTPMGFWDKRENRKKAFNWLLEKADAEGDNIYKLNAKMFKTYGLAGLLDKYNGKLSEMVIDIHPDKEIVELYKRKNNIKQIAFTWSENK